MYNSRYILPGLIIFVALFTAPFWLNIGSKSYAYPEVEKPVDSTECIEPASTMRAEHMRILNEWRDAAMRDGKRVYKASNGKMWEISLQNTCMKCHTSKEQFCDTCHTTNSVTPYCWDCHIIPQKKAAGGKK